MAAVVGFAFLVTVVTPCGKRVFLLVVTTIPNAMRCMATTAATVKKAAFGRSKSPPLAVKKQLIVSLSLTLPKEGTEKLKPTIKLKVDDGEIAVLPFIICLF